MTDCNHWLEPMLEAEKRDLAIEKTLRQGDIQKAQQLINEIRALINVADAHFAGFPPVLPVRPDLNTLLMRQQMEALRPVQGPCQGGVLGGLLGGGWPF